MRYPTPHLFTGKCLTSDRVNLVAIFLLACLVRLFLVWYLLGLDWWYNTGEGYEHTLLSEYLVSNRCYMPPGQYLFSGTINQCLGQPDFLALRLATIILSALVSVNIYRIGRDVFAMPVGIIAGYLSCISLSFAFHSWTFYPTILVAALFSFFLVHLCRMLDYPRRQDALLAGFFLGFSVLTRAEMLLFLPLALCWLFLTRGFKRDSLFNGAALLIVCSVVIGCWSVRNYMTCRRFVPVAANAPVNYFIGNNPLQTGGYSAPRASREQQDDYLRAGLGYNLNHPGWFVYFFKEKFKLCWSSLAGEHPYQLLTSKFERSTVKIFNDAFSHSRMGRFTTEPQYAAIYRGIIALYSICIALFWFFVLAGFISSHLKWRKSYFLVIVCFTTTLVLACFISGAQRWSLPVLPYVYLLMGAGIVFTFRLHHLSRWEISSLVKRNALVLAALIVAYGAGRGMVSSHPSRREEIIKPLYHWNLFSSGGGSVRLIILESQLSYPIHRDSLRREAFFVRLGADEVPHLDVAGAERNHAKYYFKRVNDLLCAHAIVINVPDDRMHLFLKHRAAADGEGMKAEAIIQALQGTITISYIPSWRFNTVVEKICSYMLEQLAHENGIGKYSST